MSEQYIRKPNTACYVCDVSIYRRPIEIRRGRVFCGQACYGKALTKATPCVICKTPIPARKNKKTCSRSCANKHRAGIKYKLNRPRDKVKSQRMLKLRLIVQRGKVCEQCSYDKVEILQVHHVDRNRDNNRLSNLALICPNCHAEEHYLKNSWLSTKLANESEERLRRID